MKAKMPDYRKDPFDWDDDWKTHATETKETAKFDLFLQKHTIGFSLLIAVLSVSFLSLLNYLF